MKSYSKNTLPAVLLILFGFVGVFFLSNYIERNRPSPEETESEDLSLQAAKLKGYTLGFDGLIADWYWMNALQYIGDKLVKSEKNISTANLKELNLRLLYQYLDGATTLDPQFTSVYEYGAMVLPEINDEQAIKLLEKGIGENPNDWKLYHHLGYIYWRLGDYQRASEVYADGAKIEGSPNWMKFMTAKTRDEGGSRETARLIYEQIFTEAEDAQTKENAARRLLQLDSLDERDAVRQSLRQFQKENNRCVNNWSELFPLLKSQKLPNNKSLRFESSTFAPLDPTGVPYVVDRESGGCDININIDESKIPTK